MDFSGVVARPARHAGRPSRVVRESRLRRWMVGGHGDPAARVGPSGCWCMWVLR